MSEIREVLIQFQGRPNALAAFLHTLSFLEYVGSRKIMKSQHANQMSLEVLGHVSEEVRHARIFKKLAEQIGKRKLGGYKNDDLLCMEEAENYFQTVDREVGEVAKRTNDPEIAYRLTTLLVEERALLLYPELESLLASQGFPGRVAGILKEEEDHLQSIRQEMNCGMHALETCREIERAAFLVLLNAIKDRIR